MSPVGINNIYGKQGGESNILFMIGKVPSGQLPTLMHEVKWATAHGSYMIIANMAAAARFLVQVLGASYLAQG